MIKMQAKKVLLGGALVLATSLVQARPAGPGPEADGDAGQKLPVGMNLSVVNAANREIVFVDAFKSASNWQVGSGLQGNPGGPGASRRSRPGAPGGAAGMQRPSGGQGARGVQGERPEGQHPGSRSRSASGVEFGADGWPLLDPGTVVTGQMFASFDGHYPAGTYVCTWTGSGRIDFQRAATITKREEHRMELEVDPTRGPIVVRFEMTDAEDPLRDIHLWMPGFEEAESEFHPLFLERLAPFSVIRFGNWMRTFSNTGAWAERTLPTGLCQAGRNGVALEYMLDLCNELGSEPWFCIPHTADAEYVRNFAELVRERLNPDLRVWVEYSNEVWNDIFPQNLAAREKARERGIRMPEVMADEALAIWETWREVFGEGRERVVRVAAGQLHNPSIARVMVERLAGRFDALAIGAYFGVRPDQEGFNQRTTPAEILEAARRNLDSIVMQRIEEHARLAQVASEKAGHKIALVTYEGGQHIIARESIGTPNNRLALSNEAVTACQIMPQMADAYRALLRGCRERGVELFMAYDLAGKRTPGDSFGHLQYLSEPLRQAPKYQALVEGFE